MGVDALLAALKERPSQVLATLTEALDVGEVRSAKASGKVAGRVLAEILGKSIRQISNGNAVYAIEAGASAATPPPLVAPADAPGSVSGIGPAICFTLLLTVG